MFDISQPSEALQCCNNCRERRIMDLMFYIIIWNMAKILQKNLKNFCEKGMRVPFPPWQHYGLCDWLHLLVFLLVYYLFMFKISGTFLDQLVWFSWPIHINAFRVWSPGRGIHEGVIIFSWKLELGQVTIEQLNLAEFNIPTTWSFPMDSISITAAYVAF